MCLFDVYLGSYLRWGNRSSVTVHLIWICTLYTKVYMINNSIWSFFVFLFLSNLLLQRRHKPHVSVCRLSLSVYWLQTPRERYQIFKLISPNQTRAWQISCRFRGWTCRLMFVSHSELSRWLYTSARQMCENRCSQQSVFTSHTYGSVADTQATFRGSWHNHQLIYITKALIQYLMYIQREVYYPKYKHSRWDHSLSPVVNVSLSAFISDASLFQFSKCRRESWLLRVIQDVLCRYVLCVVF